VDKSLEIVTGIFRRYEVQKLKQAEWLVQREREGGGEIKLTTLSFLVLVKLFYHIVSFDKAQ